MASLEVVLKTDADSYASQRHCEPAIGSARSRVQREAMRMWRRVTACHATSSQRLVGGGGNAPFYFAALCTRIH